jgi:hypothetical protein
MVNSRKLIGITEYVKLYTKCRINGCRDNRVRLYYYDKNVGNRPLKKKKVIWNIYEGIGEK